MVTTELQRDFGSKDEVKLRKSTEEEDEYEM